MGQGEMLKILKKNKNKWFSTPELAKQAGVANSTANASLNKLSKQKEVLKKYSKARTRTCFWRYNRRKNV